MAALRGDSAEFSDLWDRQEVGLRFSDRKRFVHPEVGAIELYCENLLDPEQGQSLLIFTASPGTVSYDKLALLTVIGEQFAT